jgi:hypothetical protein
MGPPSAPQQKKNRDFLGKKSRPREIFPLLGLLALGSRRRVLLGLERVALLLVGCPEKRLRCSNVSALEYFLYESQRNIPLRICTHRLVAPVTCQALTFIWHKNTKLLRIFTHRLVAPPVGHGGADLLGRELDLAHQAGVERAARLLLCCLHRV